MPIIKLESKDGKIFEIDYEAAKCSGTIKTLLDDLSMDDEEDAVIPLRNVNAAILCRALQWANYHKDDPKPVELDEMQELRSDDISLWDTDFLKCDQATLFELILAANYYLDIQGLMYVTCKTVANMIKGKSAKEIRKIFDTRNEVAVAAADHGQGSSSSQSLAKS